MSIQCRLMGTSLWIIRQRVLRIAFDNVYISLNIPLKRTNPTVTFSFLQPLLTARTTNSMIKEWHMIHWNGLLAHELLFIWYYKNKTLSASLLTGASPFPSSGPYFHILRPPKEQLHKKSAARSTSAKSICFIGIHRFLSPSAQHI